MSAAPNAPSIAKVIVDVSVDRAFDYAIPSFMLDGLTIGCRVKVPFGHRQVEGYVVALQQSTAINELKPIKSIIGDSPFLTPEILKLLNWMSQYYCARTEQCIRTVLPGAVRKKNSQFKKQRVVSLADPAPSNKKFTEKQQRIVDLLAKTKTSLPIAELISQSGTTEAPVKALQKQGVVNIESRIVHRDPFTQHRIIPTQPLELMPEQATALATIKLAMNQKQPKPILLHGVTGSGKTEVYLQAIAHSLDQNKQAIVLVPEIALTPQTVSRFLARFGKRIAVLHSHLSDGERHDEWHRIRQGDADVVIGARSAVFAPVPDLGLIVVDEEHEPSYKQGEAPRYNARDIAIVRAHQAGCPVILGSATPALESWQNANSGKFNLCSLTERADYRSMPHVRVIDMRIEAERNGGKPGIFAKPLLDAIHERLNQSEQTMLFLNRRGYASSLICPKCGYVSECAHCSVSHTYHRTDERLRCHICGDSVAAPTRCPQCGDPGFRFAGFGTQRIEAVMHKCFPHARIARMDADTTRQKTAYDDILGAFRERRIDILVGTQMITKGLHFPNVTLVGILFADMSLHLPDFRAGERTFQLITQVAGRAGRGDIPGEVFIQTYTPHHPAIQTARQLDFEGFCDQELCFRQELNYPPFAHLTCLTFRGRDAAKVQQNAEAFADSLAKTAADKAIVSEATPAPLAKAKDIFRYQVMIRARSVKFTNQAIQQSYHAIKIDKSVHLSIDVDALDLM